MVNWYTFSAYNFTWYAWSSDVNECSSDPCMNGQCQDGINQYTCICDPGWEGVNCDVSKFLNITLDAIMTCLRFRLKRRLVEWYEINYNVK